tara:strand:- start:1166 stop:1744 length:579 start_codon:yes stop_codon:yes gene_type:complete
MAITEITTKSIKDGDIINADINSSAAIAKSKLAALDIVNADVNASAAIAKSKLAALDIVNADVNASAAIAGSKVAPDFGAQNIVTTGSISGRHGRAPTNTQGSTYTLVATDAGKVVKAAGNVTLNENIFADGDMVVIYNSSSGDITLIQGSNVTLRLAGASDTGTRTIAQKGVCTVINVAANEAVAGGIGVS